MSSVKLFPDHRWLTSSWWANWFSWKGLRKRSPYRSPEPSLELALGCRCKLQSWWQGIQRSKLPQDTQVSRSLSQVMKSAPRKINWWEGDRWLLMPYNLKAQWRPHLTQNVNEDLTWPKTLVSPVYNSIWNSAHSCELHHHAQRPGDILGMEFWVPWGDLHCLRSVRRNLMCDGTLETGHLD